MTDTFDPRTNLPDTTKAPRLITTAEGASAFPIDDPLVQLVFTYGSFLPGAETYYGTPEAMMQNFLSAVEQAGSAHPLLTLQYAAWQRDPRQGKGNRSQSPWVIAVLTRIPQCVQHPRFVELIAQCIVRSDDALNITLAATKLAGNDPLPLQLKQGIARGLDQMSDYQLTKYANASISLLPQMRKRDRYIALHTSGWGLDQELMERTKARVRTLRLVDVLGICKHSLSPRLFALYRYLHAPTRQQQQLLPLLQEHLPLFGRQRQLRENAPREVEQVAIWAAQALEARMTMEQMFSATGHPTQQGQLSLPGQDETGHNTAPPPIDQQSLADWATQHSVKGTSEPVGATSVEDEDDDPSEVSQVPEVPPTEEELQAHRIRAELWNTLLTARVPDETQPDRSLPFLGDMAFLRNIRGMYQAGIAVERLDAEARSRRFNGLWPFQLLSAAQQLEHVVRRGKYRARPCPAVLPVFNTIFETIALSGLPRTSDGQLYRILGMADLSGSMTAPLGNKDSSATCMDAAVAFSTSFSYTTRTDIFGGLAGAWGNAFYPAMTELYDRPLDIARKVRAHRQGWGGDGTQIFGSMMSLIAWLLEHPEAARPQVIVVLSDMQFHPPKQIPRHLLKLLPEHYRNLVERAEFVHMPPLAAAIVLYREILGNDVSLVLWNLASYEGSPAPSGMERILLLSGFDANSFRIMERWLQAGSPGSAMPVAVHAGDGESNSSFEAVLAALRRY